MKVQVLLFAAFREMTGAETLSADLPPASTARDLISHLRTEMGHSRIPPAPAVAVNARHAPLDTPLSDGDEVALIPPVAGG